MSVFNNVIEGFLASELVDNKLRIIDVIGREYILDVKANEQYKGLTKERTTSSTVFCYLENNDTIFSARDDSTFSVVRKRDKAVIRVGTFDYKSLPFKNEDYAYIAYGKTEGGIPTILSREKSGLYKDLAFEYIEGGMSHINVYNIKKELPKADITLSLVVDKHLEGLPGAGIYFPRGDWREYLELRV